MGRYQILLTPELEQAYMGIARQLDMSMEQTLTAALQLYAKGLLLEDLPGAADDSRLRTLNGRSQTGV